MPRQTSEKPVMEQKIAVRSLVLFVDIACGRVRVSAQALVSSGGPLNETQMLAFLHLIRNHISRSQRRAVGIIVGMERIVRKVMDFAPHRGETLRGLRFVNCTFFHHGFGGAEIADDLVYAQVSGNAGAPKIFFLCTCCI